MRLPHQLLFGRPQVHGPCFRHAHIGQRAFATAVDLELDLDLPETGIQNPVKRRHGGDLGSHLPKHIIPKDAFIPHYPYGHRRLFKQANKGLYGEQTIQFGNNVSEDTETRTRRYWKPNVLSKSLYSVVLKKRIKLRLTANVLKTMDREGGLDEYLLKDSQHRVKELGPLGWALRWTLMQRPEVIDRFRADAAALGLDQAVIDKQWPTREMMAKEKAKSISSEVEQEKYEETEEQEMWEPKEDDTSDESAPVLSKEEKRAASGAIKEYRRALIAAQRYLDRGLVGSEEEGIKVAFVRAKARKEAAIRQQENYQQNIRQQFDADTLENIKAELKQPNMPDNLARKIAYSRQKRAGIEAAGGYKAWREKVEAERAGSGKATAADSKSRSEWQANKKMEYVKEVKEAESASTNKALDSETRSYLKSAIRKANKAVKARVSGGEDDYAELILRELRRAHEPERSTSRRSTGNPTLATARSSTGDDWDAIVNSSKNYKQSRPEA